MAATITANSAAPVRKKYLNADGARERIVPMWLDAIPAWSQFLRRTWCFFAGHDDAPTATFEYPDGGRRVHCGICSELLLALPLTFPTPTLAELEHYDRTGENPGSVEQVLERMRRHGVPQRYDEIQRDQKRRRRAQ